MEIKDIIQILLAEGTIKNPEKIVKEIEEIARTTEQSDI